MAIIRVIKRELRRIWLKPRYVIILTTGIAFSFIFFATLMQEGQPEKLPIGIVDLDGTFLSRRLAHELNATQGVKVKAIYNNFTEARKAMQRGEIFAFYEIPKGTYNNLLQFKAPHFGLYSNTAYLLAGTLSYKQMATLGMLAGGAVQREVMRKQGFDENKIMGLIMPVEIDTHQIGNPWMNYKVYLMTTLIPAIIAFIALLHMVYIIGREEQERTIRGWIKKAGGNTLHAMLGKTLPYTLWYTFLALVANLIMFGPMHFPMAGSWLLLMLVTMLMVFAAQSAGMFIAACIPDPPLAMGVSAIYGALSFSLSGFSFPVEAMPRVFEGISWIYPIRHYYLAYREIAIHGNGFGEIWQQICSLLVFLLLPIVGVFLMSHRLEREYLELKNKRIAIELKSKREEASL